MFQRRILTLMLVVQALGQEFYLMPTNSIPPERLENRVIKDDGRRHHSRQGVQKEVRGQSFGLEKFLSQPFNLEEVEDRSKEYNQRETSKSRSRNRGESKSNKNVENVQTFSIEDARPRRNNQRGQTFGLENIAPQLFHVEQSKKSQDSAEINIAEQGSFDMKRTSKIRERRPPTFDNQFQTTESWKQVKYREKPLEINKNIEVSEAEIYPTESENYPKPHFLPTIPPYEEPTTRLRKKLRINKNEEERKPLQKPSVFQTTTETVVTVEEKESTRPRKRVMLRRRRKRPQKSSDQQIDENNQEQNEDQLNNPTHATYIRKQEIQEDEKEPPRKVTLIDEEIMKRINKVEEKKEEDQENKNKRKRLGILRKQPEETTTATTPTIGTTASHPSTESKLQSQENEDVEQIESIESNKLKQEIEKSSLQSDNTAKKDNENVNIGDNIKKETTTQSSAHHLKTLLKQQAGTLSLSELLQTQNLSLTDFLRGNKGAISALGGKKVESDDNNKKRDDEPLETDKRKQVPKISPKSRPFSKTNEMSNDYKDPSIRDEKKQKNLPKTLDVFEVTTERTSYNGFQPKNPRQRYGHHGESKSKPDNLDSHQLNLKHMIKGIRETESKKITTEATTTTTTTTTTESTNHNELDVTSPSSFRRDRLRIPSSRLPPTVNPKETPKEPKFLPKRFGDLRPKLRIDRRKITSTTTEILKETTTASDSNEVITTESPISELTEKPIVRIPFMSSNNPDLSLILPSRNRSTLWSDRKNRDRLGSFRIRNQDKQESEEKQSKNQESENHIKGKLRFKNFSRTTPSSSTEIITERNTSEDEIITTSITKSSESGNSESSDSRDNSFESSFELLRKIERYDPQDQITELLKSGSSAHRLSKILESRNMTLEELLKKRERGSQINVEQLFQQNQNIQKIKETTITSTTSTTTTTTESNLKNTIPNEIKNGDKGGVHDRFTLFPNFPEFNYVQKPNVENKHHAENEDEELIADESFPASVKVKLDNSENRGPRLFSNFPVFDSNSQRSYQLTLVPSGIPLSIWNVNDKNVYNPYQYNYPGYENRYSNRGIITSRVNAVNNEQTESPPVENDIVSFETINKSAEANKNLKSSIDEILKEQTEVNDVTEEYEKAFIPPAVRSAIIASGVVLGIALFVFIAIFVACGCRQRHIRIRGKTSILNDSLSRSNSERKSTKKNNTLSPISFKRTGIYKKALDFETASSISNSSNASSYLWNTLRNTFTSRNNTLKNTLKNEELIRQENERKDEERRNTMRTRDERNGTRRTEESERKSTLRREEDRGIFSKIDPERNVINTSLTFKRGGLHGSSHNRFNTCAHIKS